MTNFKELVNLVYLLISFTSSCGELFYYNLCISFVVNFVIHKNMHNSSGVASPKFFGGPKNLWGAKMFDFRRATVFCMEYRFSKHKMTRYSKNFGGHDPLGPVATPMHYRVETRWAWFICLAKDPCISLNWWCLLQFYSMYKEIAAPKQSQMLNWPWWLHIFNHFFQSWHILVTYFFAVS